VSVRRDRVSVSGCTLFLPLLHPLPPPPAPHPHDECARVVAVVCAVTAASDCQPTTTAALACSEAARTASPPVSTSTLTVSSACCPQFTAIGVPCLHHDFQNASSAYYAFATTPSTDAMSFARSYSKVCPGALLNSPYLSIAVAVAADCGVVALAIAGNALLYYGAQPFLRVCVPSPSET
jgi:hypothetical protein